MQKKIMFLVATLVLIVMLVTPIVSAKPGTSKNNERFEGFVMHLQGGVSNAVEGYPISNPSEKVSFTKNIWTLGGYNDFIQIGDDEADRIYFTNDDFENLLCIKMLTKTPFNPEYDPLIDPDAEHGYMEWNYKIFEKITWDESNYIEMYTVERFFLEQIGPNAELDWNFGGSGTFHGLGEIDGQKVQLSGMRHAGFDLTVFDFVVENTGTIQFLGN
jgi:hypothetical protein